MDYEKAYKAVLQTATQWIKGGCTDKEKICLECVFPELRESEDERARKAALEGIEYLERKLGWDAIGDTDILDVKEYLEKQKYNRMKPIYDARESFESALEKAWNDYHNGYENVDKLEDDYVECAHAKGFREGYLFGIEKQKEQKPNIEICPHSIKSKSYKKNGYPIENCNYGLEIALAILEKTLGEVQGYQTDDGLREHQTAIKAVKDAMKEQKPVEKQDYSGLTDLERAIHRGFISAGVENVPVTIIKETAKECLAQMKPAEWSEEDENRLNAVVELLENTSAIHPNYSRRKLIIWLKSLRPQPKQEWSEEDETILDSVIHIITHVDDLAHEPTFAGPKWTHPYTKEIAWLKSLRPSWKPSKEQMEALERASTNEYLSAKQFDILVSLYEQLKKLM